MPASRGQQDDAGHVHAGFDASETSSTKQGHRSDWTLGDPRRRHVSCKCLIVKDGRVAQLVEQCPFKAWVAGSNPAALTIFFNGLAQFFARRFAHVRKNVRKCLLKPMSTKVVAAVGSAANFPT